jgi:hypothetical protein
MIISPGSKLVPTKSGKKRSPSNDNASVFDYIRMLKHERRILLLKALFEEKKPITFMDLLRKCKLPKDASPDASYHLTELKDKGIVVQQETKYFLSSFGEALLEKFFELEDVFSEHTAGILIRTSRYSMEPFSEEKIAAALIREAKMPAEKAVEIARETRIRLQRAKVQYLTTPLIREYINAILVEKHMEDYRHKLTRLGVPGQDIEDALRSSGVLGLQQLRTSISRETLEQFVLLRVLPKELADATLQRLIGVSRLALFPFLPEEIVVHWEDCKEEDPLSWHDLLLIVLRILSNQINHFGKLLTISGIPMPTRGEDLNVRKIEGPASFIERVLKLEDKQIRIILQADRMPDILKDKDNLDMLGKNIEIFCHHENFSDRSVPGINFPTFHGAIAGIVPCFESFYCNLLLLLKTGDEEGDLAPNIDRLSSIIASIISVKEESMLAYGYPLPDFIDGVVRIRPIGLPELVRLHRGFEIDQTDDSERYARQILDQLQARVSKDVGEKYKVQLGQPWMSQHLLPFTEAAVNELRDMKDILKSRKTTPICSPGFTRLNGNWPAQKWATLAARLIGGLPGEFYLNLGENTASNDPEIATPLNFTLAEGQFILVTHQNCMKVGSLDIPVGNLF